MTDLVLIGGVVAILWLRVAVLRLTADWPDTAEEKDVVWTGDRLG